VPSRDALLTGLTAVANDWRGLAIAWHVAMATLFGAMLFSRWRPSSRLLGQLLAAPLLSVGVVAGVSGNHFNAIVFTILALLFASASAGLSGTPVQLASHGWMAGGVALIVFGSTYPHFLNAGSRMTYLYASPLGLLPCPTLSAVIGTTLVFQSLRSPRGSLTLAAAGALYGTIGVFGLDVALDWGLIAAAAILAAAVLRDHVEWRSVHAEGSGV
jgi:hypothetical protein